MLIQFKWVTIEWHFFLQQFLNFQMLHQGLFVILFYCFSALFLLWDLWKLEGGGGGQCGNGILEGSNQWCAWEVGVGPLTVNGTVKKNKKLSFVKIHKKANSNWITSFRHYRLCLHPVATQISHKWSINTPFTVLQIMNP